MDTVLLKTFLEVARLRHFGRAAERLCVTQSAVSARIKQLESLLGTELFERRRNDIRLTAAGQRLQRHAETIVGGWERARQEVVLPEDVQDVLAIGFPVDLWSILVRDGVRRVLATQPALALRLNSMPQTMLIEQLLAGSLDLVLLFDPPQLPDFSIRRLADVPLVLASSHTPDERPATTDRDYVYVDWGSAFATSHAQTHAGRAPRVQCNAGFMAHDLIALAGGTAYLARQTLDEQPRQGPWPVRDAPLLERGAHAMYRVDHAQRQLLDALCDTLTPADD
jgi:DNA-binding transcriptional LysR family regulator